MRALAVALALALAGSAFAADPPDYAKMKAEWAERIKPAVEKARKEWGSKANAKNAATAKQGKAILEQLDRGEYREPTRLVLPAMKVDYFGRIGGPKPLTWEVLQIVGPKSALLRVEIPQYKPFVFMAELNTSGLVDGNAIAPDGFVHCYGTATYKTLAGSKTVFAIRFVD